MSVFFIFAALLLGAVATISYPFNVISKSKVVLIVVLIIISILTYIKSSHLSFYHYQKAQIENQKLQAVIKEYNGTKGIIEKMKVHLAANPTRAKGWYLLGRVYLSEKSFNEAFDAFSKAYQLKPTNSKYAFQYIVAKELVDRKSDKETLVIIDRLLKKKPNDLDLLNFLALFHYKRQHFSQAKSVWQQMLPLVESEDKKWLLEAIEKANNSAKT